MKRILITLILGILLVGTISAGVGFANIIKKVSKEDLTTLNNAGVFNYTIYPIECDEESCDPLIVTNDEEFFAISFIYPYYDDCSSGSCVRVYYALEELEEARDSFVEGALEKFLKEQEAKQSAGDNEVYSRGIDVELEEE